jgi:hypothetical protein
MKNAVDAGLKCALAGIFLLALVAHGQSTLANPTTASQPGGMSPKSLATNHPAAFIVSSPDHYRVVTNHVSLPSKSPFWKTLTAKCLAVEANGALMQEVNIQRVYGADPADTPSSPYYGAAAAKYLISEEHVPGKRFVLRNYPKGLTPGATNEWVLIAMPIGSTNAGDEVVVLWDCGVPYDTWLSRQPHPTAARTNEGGR